MGLWKGQKAVSGRLLERIKCGIVDGIFYLISDLINTVRIHDFGQTVSV